MGAAMRSSAGVSPRASQAYSESYIGHWKLAQAVASGAVVDSSGNGRNLALGSSLVDANFWGDEYGVATLPGKLGATADGLNYSAVNDSAHPSVDWTNTGLLVMGWIKQAEAAQTSGSADILGNGGTGVQEGWRVVINAGGAIDFQMHDGSASTTSANQPDFDDDVLHHFAVVYDGTTELCSIYVDGVIGDTTNAEHLPGTAAGLNTALTLAPAPNRFSIGAHANAATILAAPYAIRDVHLFHFAGGIPSTITEIIRYSRRNVFAPVPDKVVAG